MKITVLGDSIPNGFGVGREDSFVNIKDKDIEIENLSENGLTSMLTLNRAVNINADILFVYAGINDFLNGIALKSVCVNILKIVDYAKSRNIIPVVGLVHSIAEDACDGWCTDVNYISALNKIRDFREFFILASKEENFYYIDFNSKLKDYAEESGLKYDELFFDGVHPNYKTHEYMREIFRENIVEIAKENDLI